MTTDREAVERAARAIAKAENDTEQACASIGALAGEIRRARRAVERHPSVTAAAFEPQGEAAYHAGQALAALARLHASLAAIAEKQGLPVPGGPSTRSGGGGGK